MLQKEYKVVQTERFSMVYRELNWVFFKKKKSIKKNGDNRETVDPSFLLAHPLLAP